MYIYKYVIITLCGQRMRVPVVGEISSSRKLAAMERWTDPVKRAWNSRVEMREKLGPEQTFKLLLDRTI